MKRPVSAVLAPTGGWGMGKKRERVYKSKSVVLQLTAGNRIAPP